MTKTLIILLFPTLVYSQTKKEVWNYIKNSSIKQPKIVYAQVMLETGHLKCVKCSREKNNYLGFYNGKKYLSWVEEWEDWTCSIDYYIGWQIRKGYKGGDYYNFLLRKWGAPNMNEYIEKLKRIK